MFKNISSKLTRKGSSGSREQLQQQPDATASPPKLVPDAAQAARQQEAAAAAEPKAGGSGGRGGGGGKPSILRSNSGSGLLVRPKASKPSFLATSATGAATGDPTAAGPGVAAAAAAATTPKGAGNSSSVTAGVGTGPLFLTVKPDCLVLRAPASPQTTARQTMDRVLVLHAPGAGGGAAQATKSLRAAVEEGDVLGYEEERMVMGVLGVVNLVSGPYLLTIDAAQPVGALPPLPSTDAATITTITSGSTIYKVTRLGVRPVAARAQAQLLRGAAAAKAVDEARYLRLLRGQVATGALYFATASAGGADAGGAGSFAPTPTLLHRRVALQEPQPQQLQQQQQQLQQQQQVLSDAEYVWNAFALSGIEDPALRAQWGTPCISGFAASTAPVPVGGGGGGETVAVLTLVSRRSTRMQGTRFFRRGVNAQGEVANGVETELIVALHPSPNTPAPTAVLAHVQVRGSVPLPWAQTPDLSWQPPVMWEVTGSPSALRGPCTRHLDRLCEAYGTPLTAVNLIDNEGKSRHSQAQKALGEAFWQAMTDHAVRVGSGLGRSKQGQGQAAAKTSSADAGADAGGEGLPMRCEWFDFHKECAKMRWDRLELLMGAIDADVTAQGWTLLGAASRRRQRRQAGVVRTNCIDNLDRTNVVQSLVARKVLGKALALGPANAPLAPALDRAFKGLWVANADALSRSYAGTPALKTDFVLTGKRTLRGMLADGANAVTRYYVNNFWDGARQDAVALWLGDFRPASLAAGRSAAGSSSGGAGSGSSSKSPFGPHYRLAAVPGGLLFTVSKGVQELAPFQLTLRLGSLLVEAAAGVAQALLFLPDDAVLLRLGLAYLMWLLLWAALLECALTLGPFMTLKTLRRESWRLTDRPALASLTGRPAPRASRAAVGANGSGRR